MEGAVSTILNIRVFGEPKGQPRARAFAFRQGNKFTARMYDPGTAEHWKEAIGRAAGHDSTIAPITGPLMLSVVFLFPRPARLCRKKDPPGRIPHAAKPDIDNALKAVMDALTVIGVWKDDAQVSLGPCPKFYAAVDERPGALIVVETIPLTTQGTP